jgi:uncharacterized circularly permuted ATP-grasp superfamily protein
LPVARLGIPGVERNHYDEMRDADGNVRAHFQSLADWLA